ncbi:MAG TPA: hypothetical protein VN516_04845 [Candidatus Baltobacteraceae bacterium]|nr:hypothetical protein [Candidatus Baltobacteraceae bacterium]
MTDDERKKLLDETDAEMDEKFGNRIAALCRCSREELQAIVPPELPKAQFEQLMAIVGDAARTNEQKAKAIQSIAGLSEIVIGLAAKIAKA